MSMINLIEDGLARDASSTLRRMATLLDAPSDPANAVSEAAKLARELAERLGSLAPSEAKQELLGHLEVIASATVHDRSLLSAAARAQCVLGALARSDVSPA